MHGKGSLFQTLLNLNIIELKFIKLQLQKSLIVSKIIVEYLQQKKAEKMKYI